MSNKHPVAPPTAQEYLDLTNVAVERAYENLEIMRAVAYFPDPFAQSMFARAILEIAYGAIRLYSPRCNVPDDWKKAVKNEKQASRFFIGKERHGVPVGLIIYAGRNQSSHWDEPLHPVSKRVFVMLANAFDNDPHWDLVFEPENVIAMVCAGPVVFLALGWNSYETYLSEMKELLKVGS